MNNNIVRSLDASLSGMVFTNHMQNQVMRKIQTLQAEQNSIRQRRWKAYPAMAILAVCSLLLIVLHKTLPRPSSDGDPINTPPVLAAENPTFLPLAS